MDLEVLARALGISIMSVPASILKWDQVRVSGLRSHRSVSFSMGLDCVGRAWTRADGARPPGILPFNNIASAFFVDTWYRGRPQAEAMWPQHVLQIAPALRLLRPVVGRVSLLFFPPRLDCAGRA